MTQRIRERITFANVMIGPKGDKGDNGTPGTPGASGVVGAITVQREDVPLPDGGAAGVGVQASCPAGTKIIAGGATLAERDSPDINITVNRPYLTGVSSGLPDDGQGFDAWRAVFVNPAGGTGAATGRVFAVCAEVPAP